MKELFNTYYLRWFIIYSITFGLLFIVAFLANVIGLQMQEILIRLGRTFLFYVGSVIFLTLIFGGYYHLWDEYFWPRRRIKILNRQELRELEKLNFKLGKEDICYGGMYKNYYIIITPYSTINGGDSLIICAFIAPIEDNIPELENLEKEYRLTVSDESIWVEKSIRFELKKMPSVEQIIQEMDGMIKYLILNNISPAQVDIE